MGSSATELIASVARGGPRSWPPISGGSNVDRLVNALNEAAVVTSAPMGALRFSPHLYSGSEDITRSLDVLHGAGTTR